MDSSKIHTQYNAHIHAQRRIYLHEMAFIFRYIFLLMHIFYLESEDFCHVYIFALGHTKNFSDPFDGTSTRISDIGYAFYGGLWAYDGWNNLNYAVEELEKPTRNLPRSIIFGLPLVIVCYVLIIVAYLTVIPFEVLSSSSAVAVVSIHLSCFKVSKCKKDKGCTT